MLSFARKLKLRLRHTPLWVNFRRVQNLGVRRTLLCHRTLPLILRTLPVTTQPVSDKPGTPCEVHILTFNGDCHAALWTAKSFYHYAQVDYPLVWHEGGVLSPANRQLLKNHFPQSRLMTRSESTARVEPWLSENGLGLCLEARRRSMPMMKVLDFVMLSRAERLLGLDSDVLFFREPREITGGVKTNINHNLFNHEPDGTCAYGVAPHAARERYGFEMVEGLNAGLFLLKRESLSLKMMEEFLQDPDIWANSWIIEQTLLALCHSRTGVGFLPRSYLVTGNYRPGLTDAAGNLLTAKHYSGGGRALLCEEGMRQLIKQGFIDTMSAPAEAA